MGNLRGPVVTALDVGTTKICILQARVEETRGPKRLRPLALGRVQAEGISEAKVTSLDKLAHSIEAALQSLQRQSSPRVPKKVYVGVPGNYCISKDAAVTVEIKSPQRGIRPVDLERVLDKVRENYGAAEHGYRLLHIIINCYKINNDSPVCEPPLGLQAESLTVFLHLVYAHMTTLANLYGAVQRVGLDVEEMVLESYASSLAVLNDDERQNGVILLDIGGGTTDIAVFHKGSMVFSGVITIAGDKITSDLAKVCNIPVKNAELLKREFTTGAQPSRSTMWVPDA
ncbi:MAG: cell division protein FtsA, partial [Candidatus Sumerlaeaceae bacterium]|nr:cell division protein FtsA [Candidatus Sumerlaeaceae bacterium]